MKCISKSCASNIVELCSCALLLAFISGCAPGTKQAADTIGYAVFPDRRIKSAELNPAFEYLRARVNGRLIFFALGYSEKINSQKQLDTFYAADSEVLKISNGRVVSFTGLGKNIEFHFPAHALEWPSEGAFRYQKTVDHRPSYIVGRIQNVQLMRLKEAPKGTDLAEVDPNHLIWFKERIFEENKEVWEFFYALDPKDLKKGVVYSYQCVDKDLCFSLQRWRSTGGF